MTETIEEKKKRLKEIRERRKALLEQSSTDSLEKSKVEEGKGD